jgi:hypothetical protein
VTARDEAGQEQAAPVHLRDGYLYKSCGPERLPDSRSLTGDWRLVTCEPCKATGRYRNAVADEEDRARLPLIGREVMLIRSLASQLLRHGTAGHLATDIRGTADGRGFWFDVAISDPDGKPTGRISRVQVTFDRVGQPADLKAAG